jgi:hypothetical protein
VLIRMRTITGGAVRDVLVEEGGPDASLLGRHWNAIKRFLGGDAEALQPFAGKTVVGFPLETDPDTIESLATAGDIDDEGPYE